MSALPWPSVVRVLAADGLSVSPFESAALFGEAICLPGWVPDELARVFRHRAALMRYPRGEVALNVELDDGYPVAWFTVVFDRVSLPGVEWAPAVADRKWTKE